MELIKRNFSLSFFSLFSSNLNTLPMCPECRGRIALITSSPAWRLTSCLQPEPTCPPVGEPTLLWRRFAVSQAVLTPLGRTAARHTHQRGGGQEAELRYSTMRWLVRPGGTQSNGRKNINYTHTRAGGTRADAAEVVLGSRARKHATWDDQPHACIPELTF